MLCQRCKKNQATINFIENINGNVFESHLCSECYANLTEEQEVKANEDIWAGLFGESVKREKKCPVCGTKYSDYEKTGLLGCPNCYDIFRSELLPSIQRIQGRVNHVGKAENNVDELGLHRQLKSLQRQLEVALKERRYNDAGRINAQISKINKALFGGEDDD